MFDQKKYNHLGFTEKIAYLTNAVRDGEIGEPEISKIVKDDRSEEVIFNVVYQISNGLDSDLESGSRATQVAEQLAMARMTELKSHFPHGPIGRDAKGKMEYDTTGDALKSLQDKMNRR